MLKVVTHEGIWRRALCRADLKGQTPIHYAFKHDTKEIISGFKHIIKDKVFWKDILSQRDKDNGRTPIHLGFQSNAKDSIKCITKFIKDKTFWKEILCTKDNEWVCINT